MSAAEPVHRPSHYRRFLQAVERVEDGAILRVAFFALLIGTASVLYVDFRELSASDGGSLSGPMRPILPPAIDGPGQGANPTITSDPDLLDDPLEVALGTGGALHLTGSIEPGSAERVRSELEARGEYVTTVVLESPGGSVEDALAIGQMIRERGLATEVPAGALCASSCPLAFAAGAERRATAESAIGLHQVYAAAISADPASMPKAAGVAMSDAQAVTARILAHLTASGVDPALWLHALETPPSQLYYLSGEEMERYRLVTLTDDSPDEAVEPGNS